MGKMKIQWGSAKKSSLWGGHEMRFSLIIKRGWILIKICRTELMDLFDLIFKKKSII